MTYVDLPKRVMFFDQSQAMRDLAAAARPGEQPETAGITEYLEQLGDNELGGGFAHYANIGGSFNVNYPGHTLTVGQSAARVSLWRLWGEGSTEAAHYSNEAMRKISAGHFDALLRSRLATFPIGPKRVAGAPFRLRVAFIHEADWYGRPVEKGGTGLEPAAYIQACQHLIAVAVDWAITNGVTPDELGVGGLVTSNALDGPTWAKGLWPWWRAMPKWLLDSGYLTFFWDHYAKFEWRDGVLQPESMARFQTHLQIAANAGLHRYVLAETALGYDTWGQPDVQVGDSRSHLAWLKALHDVQQRTRGFELIAHFHSPGVGGLSRYGALSTPGREDVAAEAAAYARRVNLVP